MSFGALAIDQSSRQRREPMTNTLTRDHFLCPQCQAVTQFRLALPLWICPRCGAIKQPEARPSGSQMQLAAASSEAPPPERAVFAE